MVARKRARPRPVDWWPRLRDAVVLMALGGGLVYAHENGGKKQESAAFTPGVQIASVQTASASVEPRPAARPSLAFIETECDEAAQRLIGDGGTVESPLFAGFPERGATSATWNSRYDDPSATSHGFACAYDYASKRATVTLGP